MATSPLTPTQKQILQHAAQQTQGQLTWFPDTLKGGAKKKVLEGLLKRGLITRLDEHCFMTGAAYPALGLRQPDLASPVSPSSDPEMEAAVAIAEATWAETVPVKKLPRPNTKQAQIVAMLQRLEGATIKQICAVTGWLPHTVRGTLAGAFKRKFGLAITSTKDSSERVYRLVN